MNDQRLLNKKPSPFLLDYNDYELLSKKYGPSFFVLDPDKLVFNFHELKSSFLSHYHKVEIGYSYKTNYIPQLCRILHDQGAWAEVVSDMEYAAS